MGTRVQVVYLATLGSPHLVATADSVQRQGLAVLVATAVYLVIQVSAVTQVQVVHQVIVASHHSLVTQASAPHLASQV